MKRFNPPIITRSNHYAECRKLNSEIDALKSELRQAQEQLAAFKAAQAGECMPSKKCRSCSHCIEIIEHYGMGTYTDTACELSLPQCQHYQKK